LTIAVNKLDGLSKPYLSQPASRKLILMTCRNSFAETSMNDAQDFTPEVRNSAIWSGDSRKVANGKMVDVVLEKQGKKELPDLSHVEAVQMGHTMQPVIGRLFQERMQIELKDADYAITHPKHDWFRSHFDFISADGRTLVEAKNYNSAVRNKFDTDTNRIPDADYAQTYP
jgi:hypothetical protein